jgi:hypothetical protein
MLRSPLVHSPNLREECHAWAFLVILFAITSPVFAADSDAVIGNWKLVSWQVIVENEPPQNVFGPNPKGYLILTREGRSIVVTTADNRKGGMGDAERVALHKSMLSYTGKYRIEGSEFITVVDVSWNEDWNGTEQRRHFKVEGDKLFIESAPAPSIVFPVRPISSGSCGNEKNSHGYNQPSPHSHPGDVIADDIRREDCR